MIVFLCVAHTSLGWGEGNVLIGLSMNRLIIRGYKHLSELYLGRIKD